MGAVMVFSLVSKTQECLAEMPDTSAKADDDEVFLIAGASSRI